MKNIALHRSADGNHASLRILRNVLGRFATGLTIVTTRSGYTGKPVGLVVNSFNSLSLDPALILWSIDLKSSSLPAFREQDHFAVNILAADQHDVCKAFSRPAEQRFDGVEYQDGLGGAPLLKGATARLQCQTIDRYPAGDHELYIGRVVEADDKPSEPLVFHAGVFRRLSPLSQQI